MPKQLIVEKVGSGVVTYYAIHPCVLPERGKGGYPLGAVFKCDVCGDIYQLSPGPLPEGDWVVTTEAKVFESSVK